MYNFGNTVFISYRGAHYSYALKLKDWLQRGNYCRSVILFKPDSLCEKGEILMPYEYIELMEFITDYIVKANSFLFIDVNLNDNTGGYQDSYFTQAEVLQWRRFREKPEMYGVRFDTSEYPCVQEKIPLSSLSKQSKQLWAKISVGINRGMQGPMMPASFWGKYARSCYLIPCGNCGEHFLVSKKFVAAIIQGRMRNTCPHCGNSRMSFKQLNKKGLYYRNPIILEQDYKSRLRLLDSDEILQLVVQDQLPASIPLVCIKGEKFSTDAAKVGKMYAALGIGAALTFAAIEIFDWFNRDDK